MHPPPEPKEGDIEYVQQLKCVGLIAWSLRALINLHVLNSLTWAPSHAPPLGPRALFKLSPGASSVSWLCVLLVLS